MIRLAIISDVHLGDPMSVLARRDPETGVIGKGSKYDLFKESIRNAFEGQPPDYLVLLGDIIDFSVASYNETYAVARFFFQALKDDNLGKEMIYIPGNHDYDMWHTVEYQVNVTNRLLDRQLPTPFRMSVPGMIDDREDSPQQGFQLYHVKPHTGGNRSRYAGLFLDNITDPVTPFNFVYPNLYLVTQDETLLITHGQYLEAYWSVLGKLALKLAGDHMGLRSPDRLTLKEMVALNFPLCQLASSGTGQAGSLSGVIHYLEKDLREHDLERVSLYLNRLGKEICKGTRGFWGVMKRLAFWFGKREVLKSLAAVETSRYRVEFMEDPKVRERFKDYYDATVFEVETLREEYRMDIPPPTRMIFGHTHQPIAWDSPKAPNIRLPHLPENRRFYMYNSGGWLNKESENGVPEFCGAELFFYQTGKGMWSEPIGYQRKESS